MEIKVSIYVLTFHHQNAGYNINLANRSFENVAKLKYLGIPIRGTHIGFWWQSQKERGR
jgi:hypothetical protein